MSSGRRRPRSDNEGRRDFIKRAEASSALSVLIRVFKKQNVFCERDECFFMGNNWTSRSERFVMDPFLVPAVEFIPCGTIIWGSIGQCLGCTE